MADRDGVPTSSGYGWSALDLGRLLVWLRIVADNDSTLAPAARDAAQRVDFSRVTKDGYMQGVEIDGKRGRRRSYQEGRIGYEQYAAEGFARWGADVRRATDFRQNGKSVEVYGATILADKRGDDVLTSEPFVLMGLELGWSPEWRAQSIAVLAAQEERYRRTGTITMLSEDAVPEPPTYFYYYLLERNGKAFTVINPVGEASDRFPRWVSVKAAIGWHALAPDAYTWTALKAVEPARSRDRGWTAGVMEGSKTPVKAFNLNTVAVVLEASAYFSRGCALIVRACPSRGSGELK
jgi:hypothetical protein